MLDAAGLVKSALQGLPDTKPGLPDGSVALATDAGAMTITSSEGELEARAGVEPGALVIHWPSSALAQLVTGYRSAEMLGVLYNTPLPQQILSLLGALFPQRWRFSRNESWTFRA